MTDVDPTDRSVYGEIEPRFAARVILAAPGKGEDLDRQAGDFYPGLKGSNFAGMTSDENPERVAVLRTLIWAYLRSQLFAGDTAWANETAALAAHESFRRPEGARVSSATWIRRW